MAIAPLSSLTGLPPLQGRPRIPAVGRVDGLPSLAAVEPIEARWPGDDRKDPASGGGSSAIETSASSSKSSPPLDRRSSDSLLGDRGEKTEAVAHKGRTKDPDRPSEGEIRDKLTELQGEKGRIERERAGDLSQRSAEVSTLISRLKARDGEVRGHESAHVAAGGRYITGGASFTFQKGPDGIQYAVGGEVGIDSSPVAGKPEETLAKMRVVRAAALAPAEPSGADLAVAGAAAQAKAQAMATIAAEQARNARAPAEGSEAPPPASIIDIKA